MFKKLQELDFEGDLLTMSELLSFLKNQYSKNTIYSWVQREEMPYIKLRGRLWFSKKNVVIWLSRSSK